MPKTPLIQTVLNSLLGEGILKVMDLEAALKGLIVLRLRVDFSQSVVAGDDDCLRAELNAASFSLGWERILVCPLLEVVPTDLLGA